MSRKQKSGLTVMRLPVAGLCLLFALNAAAHQMLSGAAVTITGDTLEIEGRQVRLYGVTAPAPDQLCEGDKAKWRCGMLARLELEQRIGTSKVTCRELGTDGEGRVLGRCRLDGGDGVELNRWLVASGWALASKDHGQRYRALEDQAAREGAGLWRGGFRPSGDWRRIAENAPRDSAGVIDCTSCAARHEAFSRSEKEENTKDAGK